jgi:hypothetical protein
MPYFVFFPTKIMCAFPIFHVSHQWFDHPNNIKCKVPLMQKVLVHKLASGVMKLLNVLCMGTNWIVATDAFVRDF